MAKNNPPKYRMVFKSTKTGKFHQCGAIFEDDEGRLQPSFKADKDDYGGIAFETALKAVRGKKGFINIYPNDRDEDGPDEDEEDDFDSDEEDEDGF